MESAVDELDADVVVLVDDDEEEEEDVTEALELFVWLIDVSLEVVDVVELDSADEDEFESERLSLVPPDSLSVEVSTCEYISFGSG